MLQIVGDEQAYLITVTTPSGMRVKDYYDSKTGYKIKERVDTPNTSATGYGDYRAVSNGIVVPFIVKTSIFGEPIDFKVKSVEVK